MPDPYGERLGSRSSLRARQMLLALSLFVFAGSPLVYLIWRFVNEALLGNFVLSAAGLAAVALVALVVLLRFVAVRIRAWEDA